MRKLLLIAFLFLLFKPQANSQDIQATSIASPVSGCNIGWDTIRFYFYNNSPFPVGGTFNVSYSVGGPWQNATVNTSLPPGGTYLYSFFALHNFDTAGVYHLCCVVNFPGDINPSNDTVCTYITNDTTVVGGTISGPSTVCASANSGVLVLSGYNNTISNWQYSITGGPPFTTTLNDSATYAFSNVPVQTIYQVLIDGGYCPDGYSSQFILYVDQPSVAGTISGTASVCSGANAGQLVLTGQMGDTIYWQYYNSGPPWIPFANDTTFWDYLNLTQSTSFQAVVQNGVCPAAVSNIVTITVTPPTIAGTVTGGGNACMSGNNGNLLLTGSQGSVLNWISSSDGGITWNPPIANNTLSQPYTNITDTMMYCAVVQSPGCPSDTSVCTTVYVVPSPTADAGPNDTIFIFDQSQLNASGGLFYNWSPSGSLTDPNIGNPIASPLSTTTYTVTVTNAFGCTATDFMTVFVIDTTIQPAPNFVVVTNYVSLNNDGLNDVWNVINIEYYTNNEVLVFNNQGQVVFSENSYKNTWKGTYNGDQLPDGSYFYVVKVPELNYTTKGTLTITSK